MRFVREGGARRHRGAGDAARDGKRWLEAAGHYRAYLGKCPNNDGIWVQLGHALKESGDLVGAEQAYRQAIALAGHVGDSHLQLGHVLKLRTRRAEAIASYQRALALDPANGWARSELLALGAPLAASEATAAPAALAPDRLSGIETQLKLVSSQTRAIRVLSGELLKTRRENERLAAQLATHQEDNARARAALETRLAALEARMEANSPAEKPLSRLSEYLSVVSAN